MGIHYHMNWPGAGNDPFYLNNPEENLARRSYYDNIFIYGLKCDGVLGISGFNVQSYYDQRAVIDAPVDIELEISVDDSIRVAAMILAEDYFSADLLQLRVVLKALEYEIPGSGWTYTLCKHPMVDMADNLDGLRFSIESNESVMLETAFPLPAYPDIDLDNFAVVAFVQDDVTKEVHQATEKTIPVNLPDINLTQYHINDAAPGGDGDGLPEPGETCQVWVELENNSLFTNARDVSVLLSTDDSMIAVIDDQAAFGDILSGESSDNMNDPFEIEIDPDLEAHTVTFRLDITANEESYSTIKYFEYMIGIPQYLLVDDDGGADHENYLADSFAELDRLFNIWNVDVYGSPTGEYLLNYPIVLWMTGTEVSPLDMDEQAALMQYLDNGGSLLMTSQNLGDDIGGTPFYTDYMHASHDMDEIENILLEGVPGDPVSDNMNLVLTGGAYNPQSQSSVVPNGDAYPILYYDQSGGKCAGLRYVGDDFALIYTAFPLESTSNSVVGYTQRTEFLESALNWLDTPTNTERGLTDPDLLPTGYEIVSVIPNPFNPNTAIILHVPQQGRVQINVYNVIGEFVEEVHNGMLVAGSYRFNFDGANLTSGIYFVRVNTPVGVLAQRMILMK